MPRRIIALTAVLGLLSAGTALAAGLQLHTKGGYGPREAWVQNHTSASVNLIVTDHGRMLSKLSGLSCANSGAPPLDQYAGITMTVHLPHSIPISRSGHFSFSGTAPVSSTDDQTPYPVTTTLALSGTFRGGKIVTLKTIAATGKVSDSYCAATTAKQYKLIYDPLV